MKKKNNTINSNYFDFFFWFKISTFKKCCQQKTTEETKKRETIFILVFFVAWLPMLPPKRFSVNNIIPIPVQFFGPPPRLLSHYQQLDRIKTNFLCYHHSYRTIDFFRSIDDDFLVTIPIFI